MTRKVNFFFVGAPKAGTTSIYDSLRHHQEIYLLKEKELHFFCDDLHEDSDAFHDVQNFYYTRKLEQYYKFNMDIDDQKIIGDCSTSYFYSKSAAKNIYNYNPEAKILIALREPVSLMFSWYSFLN